MTRFDYKRLKAERVAKGLTVEEMGKKLGYSKGYYSRKENQKAPLYVDDFIKIINLLGISINDIHIFFIHNVDELETSSVI